MTTGEQKMSLPTPKVKLELFPLKEYIGVNDKDPIKFYNLPVIGKMYRRRVELCLSELKGGESILEIGFGSGVSFFNLSRMYKQIHGLDLSADVQLISNYYKQKGINTNLLNGNVLNMPYEDNSVDAVLLISILEHLNPEDQMRAFMEIRRVLKHGGQVVYGVPVERPLMVWMFRLLGTDIRIHHFSTEKDVFQGASQFLQLTNIHKMFAPLRILGQVYEVGNFQKV
jgi:ubiquinone/menaquinone biosynthesis C-methylase UbiE